MGSAWELVALIFRALQTRHQNNENYATIFTIFFLLAPICENHTPVPITHHSIYSNITRPRDQRLPIHDPRPHDLLLPPPTQASRHLRPTLRHNIRHPGHNRLHSPAGRCLTNNQYRHGNKNRPARFAHLHRWHWHAGILHPLLFGVGEPVTSNHTSYGERWGAWFGETSAGCVFLAVVVLFGLFCAGDDHCKCTGNFVSMD